MLRSTVSRFASRGTRVVTQRFASTKVRFCIQPHTFTLGLTHPTDFEGDTSRGHSWEAGTTQTIGAACLIWTLRGPINSVEIRALADSHWRCQS
jgi:hypothetical protein